MPRPVPMAEARSLVSVGSDYPISVSAGRLSHWLVDFIQTLDSGSTSSVPCGSCTACCRSALFVHIEPDEAATLASIPPELLFPAPRKPQGYKILPFNQDGCCPMLGVTGCTIYANRPRTCRIFDCRVFAATEVVPEQPLIAERVLRWRFEMVDDKDHQVAARLSAGAQDANESDATSRALAAIRSCGIRPTRHST